jgi:SAM-dependent methyltransferase
MSVDGVEREVLQRHSLPSIGGVARPAALGYRPDMTLPVSDHYKAGRGEAYQASFSKAEFYRRYQVELYFRPHVTPADTVLDFGCNDGLFLSCLPVARRIGVEVNPAARARCVSADIELHEDISTVPGEAVDVAISNHCLEHTLAPFETIRQIHRVLKPGGKLVLVLPFDDWRSPIQRNWRPNDPDNHLFTWSPMNIGNLLTEAGFQVERAEHTHCALSNKLKPIRDIFGDTAFRFAANLLSRFKKRSEVVTVAFKPVGKA